MAMEEGAGGGKGRPGEADAQDRPVGGGGTHPPWATGWDSMEGL